MAADNHSEVVEVREIVISVGDNFVNVKANGQIPLLSALGALRVAEQQILNKVGARHVGASESDLEREGNNEGVPSGAGATN